jgi:hypothetical protein
MVRKRIATLAAALFGAGTLVVLLSAPAQAGCINWSNTFSKGHAYGTACTDSYRGTTVEGWVVDDKADGLCVYVKVYWSASQDDSPWACPKGTTAHFVFNRSAQTWVHNEITSSVR